MNLKRDYTLLRRKSQIKKNPPLYRTVQGRKYNFLHQTLLFNTSHPYHRRRQASEAWKAFPFQEHQSPDTQ